MAFINETIPPNGQRNVLPEVPVGIQILEVGILILLIIFALLGNFCVFLMIYKTKQLQTVSNYIVANLSVSDIMRVLLSLTVSTGVFIKREWIGGDLFCQVNGFCTMLFLSGSLLSVTLISINRYYLVAKPNKAKTIFSKRNAKVMLALLWVLSLITCLPPVFGMGRYGFLATRATCFIAMGSADMYTTILVIVLIGAPFAVMILCYIRVYLAIRQSKKRIHSGVSGSGNQASELSSSSAQHSKEVKVAQTVLVLVSVYIVTWIPISVLHFIRMSSVARVPYYVDIAAAYLISLSCVTNPWIYGSKHKQFHTQLKRMFCCVTVT